MFGRLAFTLLGYLGDRIGRDCTFQISSAALPLYASPMWFAIEGRIGPFFRASFIPAIPLGLS